VRRRGGDGDHRRRRPVLHRGGVERVIHLELAADEEQKLRASAQVLRQTIAQLALPAPA
jgi:malate/lactate dehydrogenase